VRNYPRYKYSGKVLTLGVPEIYATLSELNNWFQQSMNYDLSLLPGEIQTTTNEIGKDLNWITAKTFFSAFGLTDIASIDIPGSEHKPDIVHDLNKPFPESLKAYFDLVLDPGTIEHVFDIKTALTNIVESLRVGGIVIHQVPVYSFNGGYYSINPNVLNDFYTANGFTDLKTYIVMWDRYRAYFGKHRCYEYNEQILGERHSLADYDQCRFSPHMLFFAKKMDDKTDIQIPLQFSGNYLTGVGGDKPIKDNAISIDTLAKKAKDIVKRFVPRPIFYFLYTMVRRWLFLYKSRRQSFWI
jgi:hypothetical protein